MEEDVNKIFPKCVTWLDPGLTTGWATLVNGGKDFESGQGLFKDVGEYLQGNASLYVQDMAIGYEKYIVTPGGARIGTAEPPLKVIGMAEFIGYWNACEMLPSVPSSMRLVASVQMLKKLGWYRHGLDHANQAARHMLAWMMRERLLTDEQEELLFGH